MDVFKRGLRAMADDARRKAAAAEVKVRRQRGGQWGVFVNDILVEGGFFNRDHAEDAASAERRRLIRHIEEGR
jgi:hypothetical protein